MSDFSLSLFVLGIFIGTSVGMISAMWIYEKANRLREGYRRELASIEAGKDDTEMLMKKVRLEPTSSEKSLGSASPSETSECECELDGYFTQTGMHYLNCPKFKENRG